MKLTLTSEADIINYFNYLHQKNLLTTRYPSIELEGEEVYEFVNFTKDEAFQPDVYSPNEDYEEWNGKKRWSEDDIICLGEWISDEYSIERIASEMKRTPKAIRHQARNSFGMIYRNDTWELATPVSST